MLSLYMLTLDALLLCGVKLDNYVHLAWTEGPFTQVGVYMALNMNNLTIWIWEEKEKEKKRLLFFEIFGEWYVKARLRQNFRCI